MDGKYAIQSYWFSEIGVDEVLERYGVRKGDPRYEKAVKALEKSKRHFRDGWSMLTRESVDEKMKILLREKKGGRP